MHQQAFMERSQPTASADGPRRRRGRGGAPSAHDYLHKTKLCTLWQQGRCLRRICRYAHGEDELRETPKFECTRMCPALRSVGACCVADCRYAHSMVELRAPTPAPGPSSPTQAANASDFTSDDSFETCVPFFGQKHMPPACWEAEEGDWGDGASMWARSTTAGSSQTARCSDLGGFDLDQEDPEMWAVPSAATPPAPTSPTPEVSEPEPPRVMATMFPAAMFQYEAPGAQVAGTQSGQAPYGVPWAPGPFAGYSAAAEWAWPAAAASATGQILREQCVRMLEAAMPDRYDD
mmetsp:Transcript_58044/g.168422  ORF Transcript_58044/g.168422 Transcript_58044/m.168422 type:complete len:292 (+) Transcript_58044:75-950(+)